MKHWRDFIESTTERGIEQSYRKEFESKGFIWRDIPHLNEDSFFTYKEIKILCEYKFIKPGNNHNIYRTIAQCIYYVKNIKQIDPLNIPSVLFIGDNYACHIIQTDWIIDYTRKDYDWSYPPSSPDEKLVKDIERSQIDPISFDIYKERNFQDIVDEIVRASKGQSLKIAITPQNCIKWFDYFEKNVLNDSRKKINPHQRVEAFERIIFGHENAILKGFSLSLDNGMIIKVNVDEYEKFKNKLRVRYSKQEIADFYAQHDTLVEDSKRRFQGEFYTPKVWVDEAHRMISEELGSDWYSEYLVVDCSCGTANLTRDYRFIHLVLSTINQEDINVIREQGYNKEAIIERWDFLNEEVPDSIDKKLKWAAKNHIPVLFYNNPPYVGSGTGKKYSTMTQVRNEMDLYKLLKPSQQLYAQFMFKIYRLFENYKLSGYCGFYTNGKFITGPSFKKFRDLWYSNFKYINGFLVTASDFGAKRGWGITFNLWEYGEKQNSLILPHTVMEYNSEDGIVNHGIKNVYAINGNDPKKLLNYNEKNLREIVIPVCKKGLTFVKGKKSTYYNKSIGWFYNHTNTLNYSNGLGIFSCRFSKGIGKNIFPSNFMKVCALYAARKIVKPNWINCKDEYMAPNESHPDYEVWNGDALVYSLFHSGNNCTAVRRLEWEGDIYDIKNNFFWQSKDYMLQLAEQYGFKEMIKNIKYDNTGEAYAHTVLEGMPMSELAMQILDKANELLVESFKYREDWHNRHAIDYPDLEYGYNLQAWDAGYYQLKGLWKDKLKLDYKKFRDLYLKLEKQMESGVYKFGFLMK